MRAHPFTEWLRRGWLAILCVAVCTWATGNANQEQRSGSEKNLKILNKSPWVIGIWGIAGADTGNPAMDAMAGEQKRKAREELERRENSDPTQRGLSVYERSQDLRRLEQTAGGDSANVKRTPPPIAVRWVSATSMLQALRRAKQPPGQDKAGDLERLFTLARQFYVLAIGEGEFVATAGPVILMQVEDAELAGELRSRAYLVLPDGRKIAPAWAELFTLGVYQPTPIFFFPRTLNGEPAIGPDVRAINFHYDKLDVKFNLSKMTSDHKPDL